jgi:hypothetical protein
MEDVENCEKGDTRESSVSRGPLVFGARFMLEVNVEAVETIAALDVNADVDVCTDEDTGVCFSLRRPVLLEEDNKEFVVVVVVVVVAVVGLSTACRFCCCSVRFSSRRVSVSEHNEST